MIDHDETIVAIASPSSPALRGVVRLSGNQSAKILSRLGIAETGTKIPHSVDAIVDVGAPIGNVPVRVMLWPTSRSYTGQPSAELHTVGSLPVLQALVDAITRVGGRAARPGEFTMRAFLSGRLDLTQAEAVLGVIEAEQRGSLDHALRQLAGNLSRPLQRMRADVLNLLADVEAGLDFVDEDIEFISDDNLLGRMKEIGGQIIETSEQLTVRGGGAGLPVVVIRGEPNAGKSQLLNRLTGEPSAIVADLAGTTRDTVAAETVIEGFSVTLVDTAGIEPSSSDISAQSQAHASRAANDANLRIWCVDSSRHDFDDAADRLRQAALESGRKSVIDVWVATKSDLPARFDGERDWIQCSAISGAGIGEIRRAIAESLSSRDGVETGSVIGSAARCRQSLFQASQAVAAACDLVENQQGHEFVSAELRQCATCLGEVTGAVYTDDILDRVFGRFCIGK